jgi:predicted kinase
MPLLIIVTGHPCTGKTTLAQHIGDKFSLPLISRDAIKEPLFDVLGWSDRTWSRKLGGATFAVMYEMLGSLLRARVSCIVESNFDVEIASAKFRTLNQRFPFKPFQVVCVTQSQVLLERFRHRDETGERHPGHVDHLGYDEIRERLLQGDHGSLDIGGQVLTIDTTDFDAIDYHELYMHISKNLGNESPIPDEHQDS